MDLRKLKTLLELFEDAQQVSELEMGEGENRIRLCKKADAPPAPHIVAPPPGAVQIPPAAPAAAPEPPPDSDSAVAAPMVGTFYRAASPETPPFVRIGQTVEVGQTLCIIEAMKLMNEIPSTRAGKIKEILAENGDPVGYGDRLFIIE